MDNPVTSEIPLDLGFSTVFTAIRSGKRTQTGAVRAGLRLGPHRRRSAAESGREQCSPATSDRVDGQPSATGSRRSGAGDCDRRRVETGLTGNRGRRTTCRHARETGWVGEADRAYGQPWATGQWFGAEGSGATPTGPGEGVPIGTRTDGSGNRVSMEQWQRSARRETGERSENGHRPPSSQGHDGRCDWSSRRLTPDVRSMVDLFRECPGRVSR